MQAMQEFRSIQLQYMLQIFSKTALHAVLALSKVVFVTHPYQGLLNHQQPNMHILRVKDRHSK